MSRPLSPTDGPAARPFAAACFLAALVTVLGGSAAPTPLYALYQRDWGLTPLMLSLVFAIYALALLSVLLVFGRLSDHLGRKPVILAGLAVLVGSMVVFTRAEGFGTLLLARMTQGVAAGLLTGALGAAIAEAAPRRAPLLNGIAPFFGMALGAVGSAALVAWGPAPFTLPYIGIAAMAALLMLAVGLLPETLPAEPDALARARASLRPSLKMPAPLMPAFLRLTPANIAGWSLGGFYMSLGPALARRVVESGHPMVGGLTVATITLGATGAVIASQWIPAARLSRNGAIGLILGLSVTLAAVHSTTVPAFFAGSTIAGVGMGFVFRSALAALLPQAEPHERAGVLSLYFVQSYLAFSLPAILAALMAQAVGLREATDIFATALILLAAATLHLGRRRCPRGALR